MIPQIGETPQNFACVVRDRTNLRAPGDLFVVRNGVVVDRCRVITGHEQLDPYIYGGPTPPGRYRCAPLAIRTYATGRQEAIELEPLDGIEDEFRDRTFFRQSDKFRMHYVRVWRSGDEWRGPGHSSGCVCPYNMEDWRRIKEAIDAGVRECADWLLDVWERQEIIGSELATLLGYLLRDGGSQAHAGLGA